MKLTYKVEDKPKFGSLLVFALQQLLAIMAATIAVPAQVGNGLGPAAALFGAGIGTLVYVLFTRKKSPVFLGSSFSFIPSMCVAFAGGVTMQLGYLGLIIGAAFAALVYVILSLIVKLAGVKWINKIMPAVVIGPTVASIGLSLSGSAVGNVMSGSSIAEQTPVNIYLCLACGLVTLFVTMLTSCYSKKFGRLIPFIIGIAAGYAAAAALTVYGMKSGRGDFLIVDFAPISSLFANGVKVKSIVALPDFTFLTAFKGISELTPEYLSTIAVAYVPVAFVVFAEHLADHKNLSTIIDRDLLTEPGLSRTLLGDGIGSFAGAIFGGCPNTTYGESIACVAITKNASVSTIITTAFLTIIASCIAPFVGFLESIPACVMGGVCIALYGFIAVSGLKMLQNVNLNNNKNLFVVSIILITSIGGLTVSFGKVTITHVACALILGVITNLLLKGSKDEEDEAVVEAAAAETAEEATEAVEEAAETAEETAETVEEAAETAEEAAETAEEAAETAEEAAETVEETAE